MKSTDSKMSDWVYSGGISTLIGSTDIWNNPSDDTKRVPLYNYSERQNWITVQTQPDMVTTDQLCKNKEAGEISKIIKKITSMPLL